jgi:hypothetical protein
MSSSSATVSLSGLLTVGAVTAGRAALLDAFEHNAGVVADIPNDSPVDLSGLQLVDAARLYAMQRGKAFSLAAPVGGRVRDALELCGLLEGSPDASAFWLQTSQRA